MPEKLPARDPAVMVLCLVVMMKTAVHKSVDIPVDIFVDSVAGRGEDSAVDWMITLAPVLLIGCPQALGVGRVSRETLPGHSFGHNLASGALFPPKIGRFRRISCELHINFRGPSSDAQIAPGPTQARLHCRPHLCSNSHSTSGEFFMWITLWISSVEN
jgi:hypothetical protein